MTKLRIETHRLDEAAQRTAPQSNVLNIVFKQTSVTQKSRDKCNDILVFDEKNTNKDQIFSLTVM